MWRVIERQVFGSISGDINGDFTMTYEGVFNLATQAGPFKGTFTVDGLDKVFKLNGFSQPLELVEVPTPYGLLTLPKISLGGRWVISDGAIGAGSFDAWVIFIPIDGHVGPIIASAFTMSGSYKQK